MMEKKDIKQVNPLWGDIFSRFSSRKKLTNAEVLKKCPIFKHLTDRELKKLSALIYERRYQAGEYLFDAPLSMRQVIAKLEEGKAILRRVTVPEGLWIGETARVLEQAGLFPAAEFALASLGQPLNQGNTTNEVSNQEINRSQLLNKPGEGEQGE